LTNLAPAGIFTHLFGGGAGCVSAIYITQTLNCLSKGAEHGSIARQTFRHRPGHLQGTQAEKRRRFGQAEENGAQIGRGTLDLTGEFDPALSEPLLLRAAVSSFGETP